MTSYSPYLKARGGLGKKRAVQLTAECLLCHQVVKEMKASIKINYCNCSHHLTSKESIRRPIKTRNNRIFKTN